MLVNFRVFFQQPGPVVKGWKRVGVRIKFFTMKLFSLKQKTRKNLSGLNFPQLLSIFSLGTCFALLLQCLELKLSSEQKLCSEMFESLIKKVVFRFKQCKAKSLLNELIH